MNMETPDWEWVEEKMQSGPWESLSAADQQALSPWYDATLFNRERALLAFAQQGFMEDKATIVPPFVPKVEKRKSSWTWWPWMGVAAACLAGVWWWLAVPEQGKELAYEPQHNTTERNLPSPEEASQMQVANDEQQAYRAPFQHAPRVQPVEEVILMKEEDVEAEEEFQDIPVVASRKQMATPTTATATMDAFASENVVSTHERNEMSANGSAGAATPSVSLGQTTVRFYPPKSWKKKDTLTRGDTLFIRFSRKGQSDTLVPAHHIAP